MTPDLRGLDRDAAYQTLRETIESVLAGIDDIEAEMATIACLVHHGFGHLWTGFYRVVAPRLLRVGPYQGGLGCLEIAFGRGVCGTVAEKGEALVVADVDAFPGHIRCDAAARSEIVLPVRDRAGALIAVFDVDAATPNAFDDRDRRGLAAILARFQRA
jgi:GAF domain-containing protein